MPLDVEAAYRRFGPMVRRRCTAMLGDPDAARDAAQEVFVIVLHHKDRFDANAPSRLLWTIATRVCLNALRAKRRRPSAEPDALDAIVAADDPESAVFVRRLLETIFHDDALAVSTRTLAVMHWVDGMTLEQTAEASGLSVSGVRKRLRALQARSAGLSEVA